MNRRERRAQASRGDRVALYDCMYDDETDERATELIDKVLPSTNVTHVYFDVCVEDPDRAERLVETIREAARKKWPKAEISVAASAPELMPEHVKAERAAKERLH